MTEYHEMQKEAAEARIGADRMAMGLSCIPDPLRGDMAEIERLREEGTVELAKAMMKIERQETALERIEQWSRAYPLTIFPEPNLKRARELLEAGGMTLDAISAHAMRHVVEGVGKIARRALENKP